MIIPYFSRPLTFTSTGLLLEYDYDYNHPKRHYRLDPKLSEFFQEILHGFEYDKKKKIPENIDFEAFQCLDLPLNGYVDRMVIDSSIGGPSYWARDCHGVFQTHGLNSVFISFFFKKIIISDRPFELPGSLSKYSYNQIVRSILKNIKPDKILVIGREIGSKLCDFKSKRVLVETGFGEEDILQYEEANQLVSKGVVNRALSEILFRNDTYPWDSLAHLICASEAIKGSEINVLWSEHAVDCYKKIFKSCEFISQLPSFHMAKLVPDNSPRGQIMIIASTGSHIIGERTIKFLSIDLLCELVPLFPELELLLISRYPEKLTQFVGSNIRVEMIGDKESSIDIYRKCDVFFRVQNDSSLPMSCLEAMALGKVVIMNKEVRFVSKALKHKKNVLFSEHSNRSELRSVLDFLVKDQSRLHNIRESARVLATLHCDIEKNLTALSLL
jgi:hypothetical protein